MEIRDPADRRRLVAIAPSAPADVLGHALDVASGAAAGWARVSPLERGDVLARGADAMQRRSDELAHAMTAEMGKLLRESHAEVDRAVQVLRYFSQATRHQGGAVLPLAGPHESAFTLRVPLGVVGVITPWNFPLVIPTWKVAAALVFGNAVILKPAELAPLSATALVECLLEGGVPADALTLILGRGSELGPALLQSRKVAGVSFTGSTAVGRSIAGEAAQAGVSVQCEMGGRNAIVVMSDADLDAAVETVVLAGFGTSGQRCTASSRVIAERGILEELTERLLAAAARLNVGPGSLPESDVGPLVSGGQRDDVLGALARAVSEGGEVLSGGRPLSDGALAHGHFMEPAILTTSPHSWFAAHEVFGPVVTVLPAEDFDDAVRLNNSVPYGLTSGIFTSSLEYAMRFIHETDTGMVHVNRPTVGAEPHLPFGGAKASSMGPPEMAAAWQFYTKTRAAHLRWGL